MDRLIIFIFDSIVPGGVIALIGFNIYARIRASRTPKYYPGQEVMAQNYKTAAGGFVKCKIESAGTRWYANNSYCHYYTCREVGNKNNTLELSEDRIKKIQV